MNPSAPVTIMARHNYWSRCRVPVRSKRTPVFQGRPRGEWWGRPLRGGKDLKNGNWSPWDGRWRRPEVVGSRRERSRTLRNSWSPPMTSGHRGHSDDLLIRGSVYGPNGDSSDDPFCNVLLYTMSLFLSDRRSVVQQSQSTDGKGLEVDRDRVLVGDRCREKLRYKWLK